MANPPVVLAIGTTFDEAGLKKAVAGFQDFEKKIPLSGMQKAGQGLQNLGKKFTTTGASLTKNITVPLVAAGGALFLATQKASDLQESITKTEAVFGDSAPTIIEWSKTTATALGQSQQSALEATATYGNLFQAFGLTREQATGMSMDITTLAADLASFNNVPVEDVFLALRSGLSGETEPLKRFGIALNDQRLRAEAAALGLGTFTGTLPVAAKAQAAYSLILKDSTLAQGDFARTSDGLANQQRILKAELDNAVTSLGSAFLPILLTVVNVIRDRLVPFVQALGDRFNSLSEGTRQNIVVFGALAAALGPTLLILGKVTSGVGSLVLGLDKAITKLAAFRVASIATFVTNPAFLIIGGIVLAIAGLVAIFTKAYQESEILRNAVSQAFNTIKAVISNAIQIVRDALQRNAETIGKLQVSFKALGDFIGRFIVPIFTTVLSGAINFIANVISGAIDLIGAAIRFSISFINGLLSGVQFVINGFIDVYNRIGPVIARANNESFTPLEKVTLGLSMATKEATNQTKGYVRENEHLNRVAKSTAPAVDQVADATQKQGAAAKKATEKILELNQGFRTTLRTAIEVGRSAGQSLQDLGGSLLADFAEKILRLGKFTEATAKEFDELVGVIRGKFDSALAEGKRRLDEATAAFNNFRDEIARGIASEANFSNAAQAQGESIKAVEDALLAQTKAQKAVNDAIDKADEDALAKANEELADANRLLVQARANQRSFLDFLRVGVTQAEAFSQQVIALTNAGASLQVIQQIVSLGATVGGRIAAELLAGGSAAIAEANRLLAVVDSVSQAAGIVAARRFFQGGIDAANAFIDALKAQMGELDSVIDAIMRRLQAVFDMQNRAGVSAPGPAPTPALPVPPVSIGQVATIPQITADAQITSGQFTRVTSGTGLTLGFLRNFAKGGIVQSPTAGLIGEAGPEAVIPLNRAGNLGMGNTYNITVNAGIGTNGADVGRVVVESIRKYEKIAGQQFVSA